MRVLGSVLLLAAVVGASTVVRANGPSRNARISDLRVLREGEKIAVSFQMVDAFNESTVERIQSGLPTDFLYIFKIERPRKWWFDRVLARTRLRVVAIYNAVTREYTVNYEMDGRLIETRVVQDLDELQRAMTSFHALPVLTLPERQRQGRLFVRVRCELGSRTVLAFIPTSIRTDWESSRLPVDSDDTE